MSLEQSLILKKQDQTQVDSIILPSVINEEQLEIEINKRVNKSINRFFVNLN